MFLQKTEKIRNQKGEVVLTPEINNGDYVKSGKTLKEIEYIDELLQNVALNIRTEKGRFYPDKILALIFFQLSIRRINTLSVSARQAVSSLNGVYIKSVKITDKSFEFTVIVNNLEKAGVYKGMNLTYDEILNSMKIEFAGEKGEAVKELSDIEARFKAVFP